MTQTTTPDLTREEIEAFIHLQKLSKIKFLRIRGRDLDQLLPESKVNTDLAEINLNTRVIYKVMANTRQKLGYLGQEPSSMEDMDEYRYQHWFGMLNELNQKLGFNRLIELFAENLDNKYEALSTGQSHALMKKFFDRARDDGKTLSSTTRSQLQQIKDKILKYRPLVNNFGPLFITGMYDYIDRHGPSSGYAHGKQVNRAQWDDIIADTSRSLSKAPPKTDHASNPEIKELREKIRQKGLDPDKGSPELDPEQEIANRENIEELFFLCTWPDCFHREEFETDDEGKIIQKMHHDRPMALRLPRDRSDYS